ncbi:hypothetical protein AGOR_G00231060 [Albula goreensis]|uniref:Uncharacterized protein n=1 Tax=Albula goreensis TaxID=1534307 RepID=A0A8T3CH96_9TELE|nr:hypothetical protein AGOR_G00231060 [Albula goreensis]
MLRLPLNKVWLTYNNLRVCGSGISMTTRPGMVGGVTAHKINKTITLYVNESAAAPQVHGQARPLLLLLPWLGSRPQGVAKYRDIYFKAGFDVLIVETKVSWFLWPRWGLEYGAQVLEILESDKFSSRPLLVHAFSIGGYTFTQLLVHMSQDQQRYQRLMQRVIGQIYDSLVCGSLDHMAVGLGKTMFPQFVGLVRQLSLLYFWMFKRHTADQFESDIAVFWNSPIMAPALFFFCQNDPLCDAEYLEQLTEHWRNRGVQVEGRKWKKSVHACHLREHPQEYLSALEHFLSSLSLTSLRAKL